MIARKYSQTNGLRSSCRYMDSVPADSSAVRSTLGKRSNAISTTQTPETTANIQ